MFRCRCLGVDDFLCGFCYRKLLKKEMPKRCVRYNDLQVGENPRQLLDLTLVGVTDTFNSRRQTVPAVTNKNAPASTEVVSSKSTC